MHYATAIVNQHKMIQLIYIFYSKYYALMSSNPLNLRHNQCN